MSELNIMELVSGVCGICTSNCLVLNPEDSQKYFNLICTHFHNELNISYEYSTNFNLCTTCIHHITLINSNKDYFLHEDENEEIDLNDKCALCTQTIDLFSINDSNFLNKCKSWINTAERVKLCVSCFHLIEVRHTLKENLSIRLSKTKDLPNMSAKSRQRGPMSRRKSMHQEVLSNGHEEVSSSIGESPMQNPNISNSLNSSLDMSSTPVRNKRKRRSKNLEKLLTDDISVDLNEANPQKGTSQRSDVFSQHELKDYNLSNIKNLSPLCDSKVDIDNDIKSDKKMYNCIPFVKITKAPNRKIEENHCNYVCSVVSQRPMIRMRRTPPIKIRCIKNIVLSKGKAIKNHKRKVNKSVPKMSNEELLKNELVVMLERMKMPLKEKSISIGDAEDDLNVTQTPKKKKRVHFNDTPTIIFTDTFYNDGLEEKIKNDESKKTQNLRSIMITDQQKSNKTEIVDEVPSDNEELITLNLDSESDNESLENSESRVLEDQHDKEENEEDSGSDTTRDQISGENQIDEENTEIPDEAEIIEDENEEDTCSDTTREQISEKNHIDEENTHIPNEAERIEDENEEDTCSDTTKEQISGKNHIDEKNTDIPNEAQRIEDENEKDTCSDTTREQISGENHIDEENSVIPDEAERIEENLENSPPETIVVEEILSDEERISNSENQRESDDPEKVDSTEDPSSETCEVISSDPESEDNVSRCQIPEQMNVAEVRRLVVNEHLEPEEGGTDLVKEGLEQVELAEKKNEEGDDNIEEPEKQVENERDSLEDFEIPEFVNTTPENIFAEESSKDQDTQETEENAETNEDDDSLNGFEVIDEDDESNINKSVQMEDDIDLIVQKYCEKDSRKTQDKAEEVDENSVQPGVVSEGVNTNDEGIEHNEKEKSKQPEGFGPLIDEVQKCLLTSTKDGEGDKNGSSPNTSNLLDILDDSFNESDSNGKSLKRKNCDDQFDEQVHKKIRSENC